MFENLTFESKQALLDIQLIQGDSKDVVLSFNVDAGQPLPLIGYSIRMDIKSEDKFTAPPVLQKGIGGGLTVNQNSLTISFGAETKDLLLGTYYYDILFAMGGKEVRMVAGRLLFKDGKYFIDKLCVIFLFYLIENRTKVITEKGHKV